MKQWTKIKIGLAGAFLIGILFFYPQSCSFGIDAFSLIVQNFLGFNFTGEWISGMCDEKNKFLVLGIGVVLAICCLLNRESRPSLSTYRLN